jgi:hypothetical protein
MAKRHKTTFIGCGTGRSGTTSLASLIDGCEDAVCMHERRPLLPWIFDEGFFQEHVAWFLNASASTIGDVAFFYLPYIERFLEVFPRMKVLCIERDRQEVVDSYMAWTQWRNHWYDHDGSRWFKDHVWDQCYPKYHTADKLQAIGSYWDDYQRQIRFLANKYSDNIGLFDISILNNKPGQNQIFDFLCIINRNRRYPRQARRYNVQKAGLQPWSRDHASRWMHDLCLAEQDLDNHIPHKDSFILVDQDVLRDYVASARHTIPFIDRNGRYWGPPKDDATAIRELHRLRQSGASFIAFGWPAFWWFDYYADFHRYLETRFPCVLRGDRLIIYDLRSTGMRR